MEVVETTAVEFDQMIGEAYQIYAKGAFTALNDYKVDEVYYLLFKDSKFRLGISVGIKNSCVLSPFSAPFGGFVAIRDDVKLYQLDAAVDTLLSWSKEKKFNRLIFTLPPSVYHMSFIAKQQNVLYRKGFKINKLDLNYSFLSSKISSNYLDNIWRNARKNLKRALKFNLSFTVCSSTAQKKRAFQIIKQNRDENDFPLRMTWEQVSQTIELIEADFFICYEQAGKNIGSAMVFHVADDIVQVIYWGDLPEYSHLKTMNYLSYEILKYYKKHGKRIVDLGPATENSEPNHGLSEFKESIGCDITPKVTFEKTISY